MNFSKFADFEIKSSSLKKIRDFSRKIFKENQELENEQEKLILAIAEAAQNILKHAYENKNSSDKLSSLLICCAFFKCPKCTGSNEPPKNPIITWL